MIHEKKLKMALQLARNAEGRNLPDPLIGAVYVKTGHIIGTGDQLKAGTPRPEVHTLQIAGHEAAAAYLYVTLEPCAHTSRTPPYTERFKSSDIRRFFIAANVLHPTINGQGIELLRKPGIEVTGGLQEEAAYLNRAFFHFNKHGKPYVTLKAAVTLDGYLATQSGNSKWITSEDSRTEVHHLRYTHDAILVDVQNRAS